MADYCLALLAKADHQRAGAAEGYIKLMAEPVKTPIALAAQLHFAGAGFGIIAGIDNSGISLGNAGANIAVPFQQRHA